MNVMSRKELVDLWRSGKLTQDQLEDFLGIHTVREIIEQHISECYSAHYA